jgi:hypothetical protein
MGQGMNLLQPEICQQIIALHVLLGSPNVTDEKRDERRRELLGLLTDHGLKWTDWPEFFASRNVQSAQSLPTVDSKSWKTRCQKICQLHAAMGSSERDGPVAYKKLIKEIAKQQFSWSSDLPAILAADWVFKNPPASIGAARSQTSAHMPGDFTVLDLVLVLLEDYLVLSLAQRIVVALWILHAHVYDFFEYTPRLALISPDSGYGKTRTLKLLKKLILEAKLTKNTTAPAMFRRLERWPRTSYLLDEGENQPILTDPVMRSVIDGGYERGGTVDRADGEFPVFFPCAYAIRGSEYDVPAAIRSRSFNVQMTKGTPKHRFDECDPACVAAFVAASDFIRKWAAATSLDPNPEMPATLLRDSRTADNCRPLLAISDTFGRAQGEAARAALIELCAGLLNQGPAHRALNACKAVCDTLGDVDRIEGKALARGVRCNGGG